MPLGGWDEGKVMRRLEDPRNGCSALVIFKLMYSRTAIWNEESMSCRRRDEESTTYSLYLRDGFAGGGARATLKRLFFPASGAPRELHAPTRARLR